VSAAVVGIGFSLRGFIDDMIWGFVRRCDPEISAPIVVELPVQGDNGVVAKCLCLGSVDNMSLTNFEFRPSKNPDLRYVMPWSALRSYQYSN